MIRVLTPKIYNRISAGEVVEKPCSIVKELVENSIDAKATNITIEIENGGIKKIRVSDNGSGIEKDDFKNVFMPHATSKIQSEDDLDSIATLGFRGEALASISAVTNVVLISRHNSSEMGYMTQGSAGLFTAPTEIASKVGTSITASDLFYNVPARAKFLRKPKIEENEITNFVERIALGNPHISFKYIIDGKEKYNTTSCDLKEVIYTIYGKDVYNCLLQVDYSSNNYRVFGYIASPKIFKSNRSCQSLFVNGRYVEDYLVSSAVSTVMERAMLKGKFPVYVLNLVTSPSNIDVNVHPSKMQVKFQNPRIIFNLIFNAISKAMENYDPILSYDHKSVMENTLIEENEARSPLSDKSFRPVNLGNYYTDSIETSSIMPDKVGKTYINPIYGNKLLGEDEKIAKDNLAKRAKTHKAFDVPDFKAIKINKPVDIDSDDPIIFDNDNAQFFGQKLNEMMVENERKKKLSSYEYEKCQEEEKLQKFYSASVQEQMQIIGTAFKTYIIVELDDYIYIIDQHAAHERILFDNITKNTANCKTYKQPLLFAYEFEVSTAEFEIMEKSMPILQELGFEIARQKGKKYKISAVPMVLKDINLEAFTQDILAGNINEKSTSLDIMRERLCQYACKHAIKAGDVLQKSDIAYLIETMRKGKLQCPHGRPSVVAISQKEFEKMFQRVVN